jgi:hypothetical protein
MVAGDENLVRKSYQEDVKRLLHDLEISKQLIAEKDAELEHLNTLNHKCSIEYAQNLESLVSENNLLRNEIKFCEISKDN